MKRLLRWMEPRFPVLTWMLVFAVVLVICAFCGCDGDHE